MMSKRADFPCPSIGSSHRTESWRSPLTGETFTSDRKLMDSYKEYGDRHGGQVEVGIGLDEVKRRQAEAKRQNEERREKSIDDSVERAFNYVDNFGSVNLDAMRRDRERIDTKGFNTGQDND